MRYVYLKDSVITYPKQVLSVSQIITIDNDLKVSFRTILAGRIGIKRHLFNKPKYMYISYVFMFDLFTEQFFVKIWHIDIEILIFIEVRTWGVKRYEKTKGNRNVRYTLNNRLFNKRYSVIRLRNIEYISFDNDIRVVIRYLHSIQVIIFNLFA